MGGARLLALPERKVLWSDENHLTFFEKQNPGEVVDPGRFVAVASLPVNSLNPRSIVLTSNGADAFVLSSVAATAWEGRLVRPPSVRVVERWNLATRTRVWSRTLPAMPNVQDGTLATENDDLLTLGPRGLFATRCMMMRGPSLTNCHVVALDERTGALGAAEAWSFTDFSFSWWNHGSREVSPGRRYTLVDAYRYWQQFPHFLVFDDVGRIVGRVRATCARFAEGGSEERPTILVDEQSNLAENADISRRFRLIKDTSACQLEQHLAEARKYQKTDDRERLTSQFNWVGGGRRIVWSSLTQRFLTWDKLPRAHSMDVDRLGLPTPLPEPPGVADTQVLFAGSGSDLYAYTNQKMFHLEETGFVLDAPKTAPGVVLIRGDEALMATYAGLDDSKYVLLLGKRRPVQPGFTWQKTSAVSTFRPDFVSFEHAGRPQMLIAGGMAGLQWVDTRTGQVFLRSCSPGAPSPNRCSAPSNQNDYRGLVVSSARQTAFTVHQKDPSIRYNHWFEEIELSTGNVRRSFPAPDWDTTSPLDLPMGWLEKERRFWIVGHDFRAGRAGASVTIVTLPATDGAEPHYASFATQSQPAHFGADPEGRFFAFARDVDTIDVFAPNGSLVVTLGVRAEGAFAQAGDGRFACSGKACDEFRCVVGNVARLATDPACAAFRVEGFAIAEEVSRALRVREAGKVGP
ncbi:hypothetical protein [Polyangium mundeleinium]|uniref:Lipoprotein LpqB beta-propeller domain-containing protein n=1 Tax=Polyangium mundeleinium TaxID=2995306 RepID=A0ABT5EXM0_9BACT|nr:hypothetical protein [Polyangium mundeleinium]MDC0746099.1 hypothetical protein [Polyangium mundeleinium]